MADKGFGSDLWKNVQAVRLGKDGGIEAPVRASSTQGIVVGVDAVAESEATRTRRRKPTSSPQGNGFWRRLFRR